VRLGGLVKSSLIDYPSRVSCVVFTQGCNFRCGFCHNPDLIPGGEGTLSEIEFFEFLETRRGKLDGVVITGGEPTIQADLTEFIRRIKDHGFSVKLDTNGSNPEVLRSLITEELIDFVAMDIKGPLEKYSQISRFDDTDKIKESIKIILNSGLPHEFRTTVLPTFHELSDFDKIGELIKGAQRYAIQGFRGEVTFDKALSNAAKFTREDLLAISGILDKYVNEVFIRENL
jgi:pyruvate formate lyase activating enzyme